MIKRLYVDNYKCLVNFELNFDELTLLLGVNGAGKTSVMDVMIALRQLLRGVAKANDPGVFPASSRTRWQSRATQVVEMDVVLGEDELTYRIEVEHDSEGRTARVRHESLKAAGKPLFEFIEGDVQQVRDDYSPGPAFASDWTESALARVAPRRDSTRVTRFLEFMHRIVVVNLQPQRITSSATTEDAWLARDGGNFASWYRNVFQEYHDALAPYLADLKEVLAGFNSIRLERVSQGARVFSVVFREGQERFELGLEEMSDGERALLALYAVIHLADRRGTTLFLDEPDNYLALPEIQPWLFALQDALGEGVSQAVLTSHHPELIDYLGADAGVWLEREDGGHAKAKLLKSMPEDGLKLSELVARGWLP